VTASGDALLAHDDVRGLIKGEVTRLSEKFKGFESVREFALIDQDFTTDNGMLTPSLKLKRRKVMEVHGALLEGLYAKKPKAAVAEGAAA
jgi:long-chain acyl-CoA synthetase